MRWLSNRTYFNSVLLSLGLILCLHPVAVHSQNISSGNPFADAIGKADSERINGDYSDAVGDYLKGINLAVSPADSASTRSALFAMITSHGLPHSLTPIQLNGIKAQTGTLTVLDEPRGVELLYIDGQGLNSLDNISDPQYKYPYPALVGVYMPDLMSPGSLILDCDLHYQTTDDQDFAFHTGRLLALLREVLEYKTGQFPQFDTPFDVWLSRSESASPGGEEWQNNVYLYNIGDTRSSIEWIREIAHEYSHLAFPPLGGKYTSPEAWANGYAGERLLVRWLTDPDIAGGKAVEEAWGKTFQGYANFKAKLIDSPLELYKTYGLRNDWLAKHDDIGMRYMIGLLLTVDESKGSKAVGTLLWDMPSPDPSALFLPCKALGLKPATKPISPPSN